MRKLFYLALILVMMVAAACGGGDEPAGDDAANDTADNEAASSNDDDNGSVVNTANGTFSFTVTGADERTVTHENGTIAYSVLDFGDSLDAPTKNELFMYEGSFGSDFYQVTFNIPQNTTPGTYEFASSTMGMFEEDAFTASYSTVEMGESDSITDADSFEYAENVSGSLTITAVDGDQISGTFEFSADYVDFTDEGQVTETVNVSGEFADVPLRGGE